MDDTILMAACTSAVGLFVLWATLINHEGLFSLRSIAFLQRRLGRQGARWAVGILGCGLVLMAASYFVFP